MQPSNLITLPKPSLTLNIFESVSKREPVGGLLSTYNYCALVHTEMFSKLVRRPTDPGSKLPRDIFRRPNLPYEQRVDRFQEKFVAYNDFP